MELTGTRHLNAAPDTVWAMLNDTDVLARCIPGCQSLERLSDTEMKGIVAVKVGPVSAKFQGDVTLSDIQAPTGYTISGSGKAGAMGGASGSARVTLAHEDGGTRLDYVVEAGVVGKLAQVGSRLIDAAATKLAGQFFDALEAEFPKDAAETAAPAPQPEAASPEPPAADEGGFPPWALWAIGAAIVAFLVYALGT